MTIALGTDEGASARQLKEIRAAKQQAIDEQRVRCMRVSAEFLVELSKEGERSFRLRVENGLPENTALVRVGFDEILGVFLLYLASMRWEPVGGYEPIPEVPVPVFRIVLGED